MILGKKRIQAACVSGVNGIGFYFKYARHLLCTEFLKPLRCAFWASCGEK